MTRPVHGGANTAELRSLGIRPADVLDFSASVNPLGAAPAATAAMLSVDLAAYPDPDCIDLRDALAERHGVSPQNILVGNGSTELIHLTAQACLAQGDTAIIFTPTFGEYASACAIQQAQVIGVAADQATAFSWDIPAAAALIAERRPSVAFLCNPNNPSGRYLSAADVRRIADALPSDGLLLLDEAYLPFVERHRWDSLPLLAVGNVALLRSMTKDYALTALRLGYMLAPPSIIARIRRCQHSWAVNAVAQAAGIAALADSRHIRKGRHAARKAKRYIAAELTALGLECVPSDANFILVKVGDAAELRHRLLTRHHIGVRDCASFGLPEYIRIGMRTIQECERLVAALRQERRLKHRESY